MALSLVSNFIAATLVLKLTAGCDKLNTLEVNRESVPDEGADADHRPLAGSDSPSIGRARLYLLEGGICASKE